jgi:pimeloyl-ACP methyl ester carboxylesterase
MYLQMQVHTLCWVNFCCWRTWRSQFQGESSWPKSRFIHSNGCYPGRQAREQYYRTAVAIFKVGGPWLGRTLLHPRVDLAFHYAQWKCNVDLELVSPETLLPATTVPVLLIHGRDDRNTEKTLITKARVVLDRSVA